MFRLTEIWTLPQDLKSLWKWAEWKGKKFQWLANSSQLSHQCIQRLSEVTTIRHANALLCRHKGIRFHFHQTVSNEYMEVEIKTLTCFIYILDSSFSSSFSFLSSKFSSSSICNLNYSSNDNSNDWLLSFELPVRCTPKR